MVVLTLTVAAPVVNVPHSAGAAESSKASPRAGLNLQERIIGPGSKPRSLEVDGDDYRIRRSEEHTSELQSQSNLVCRLLLEKKNPISSCRSLRNLSRPRRRDD